MALRIICAIAAILALAGIGGSASTDNTLYYIDATHNVCSINIDPTGKPVGGAVKLTRLGIYNSYSVSLDEKITIGLACPNYNPKGLSQWNCYIERPGQAAPKLISRLQSDFAPYVQWSAGGKLAFLSYGYEDFIRVWDLAAQREVTDLSANYPIQPSMTADDRYMLMMDYTDVPGEGDNTAGNLYAFDPKLDKSVTLAKILYLPAYSGSNCTWIGSSHACAWIDTKANVYVAQISSGKRGPQASRRQLTKRGGCSDLRAVGKGIYFVQTTSSGKTAYYSPDLKTLQPGNKLAPKPSPSETEYPEWQHDPRLPRGAWRHQAIGTADDDLIVCPVDAGQGKMPILTIFDKSGNSYVIGPGKVPQWKGSTHIWR